MSARGLLGLVALALAAGCYTVAIPDPRVRVAELELPGRVVVEPRNAELVVACRSASVGIANRYALEIGDAFGRYTQILLGGAFAGEGERVVVRAELEEASVQDFAVHLTASFQVELEGAAPYRERYVVEGPSYFEGSTGAESRAVVLALQRSAHDALVLAFREFLGDFRARHAQP